MELPTEELELTARDFKAWTYTYGYETGFTYHKPNKGGTLVSPADMLCFVAAVRQNRPYTRRLPDGRLVAAHGADYLAIFDQGGHPVQAWAPDIIKEFFKNIRNDFPLLLKHIGKCIVTLQARQARTGEGQADAPLQ